MSDIKSLLIGFQDILAEKDGEKSVIVDILNRLVSKDISKNHISFYREYLIVKSNPYMRSEISLKKDEILKEFKKQGIKKMIKDIR